MQTNQQFGEQWRLFSALCDETITAEEGRRLAEWVRSDPAVRVAYVRFLDLHVSLGRAADVSRAGSDFARWLENTSGRLADGHRQPEPAAVACRSSASGAAGPRHGVARRSSPWPAAVAVAVALLLVPAMLWYAQRASHTTAAASPAEVAQLSEVQDCVWDGDPLARGARLRAGQSLVLRQGVAKLVFDDGARVFVDGPASFEVVSSASLRLQSGTLAVRADRPKRDFVVLTRDGSLVDLGTSFGVHCDPQGVIDVEVFEGSVAIRPDREIRLPRVLGLGASARILPRRDQSDINMFATHRGRFIDLLQMLWEDTPSRHSAGEDDLPAGPAMEFAEADTPGAVDSFRGSGTGRGWVTPWVGSGHPLGEILHDRPLSGAGDPYLSVHFFRYHQRTIAREYGATRHFDPERPHRIRWRWRFDGTDPDFGQNFRDRVTFFGNPYFRENSSADATWMIGWIADHRQLRGSTIPKQWYFFDGADGSDFRPENMVETNMHLKPGVVYKFVVTVYPDNKTYDARIEDDTQVFTRTGLRFRNQQVSIGKVLHFNVGSSELMGDASFSLDAVRIEPLGPAGDGFDPVREVSLSAGGRE